MISLFCKLRYQNSLFRGGRRTLSSKKSSIDALPSSARVVVMGGGIIGNSVAYHLAKMGMNDVVLLEQSNITSGTTWHAAGLMVTFGSLSETSTEIRKYSKELYRTVLEQETGQSTGFNPVGFIELASTKDRLEEYRRVSAFNRRFGVNVQELSPQEVKEKFPLCNIDDLYAGFYVEDDGRVNPVDTTVALNKGLRKYGAKHHENVRIEQVLSQSTMNGKDDVITGVLVSDASSTDGETKEIKAEYVVNCTGMWARQLAQHSSGNNKSVVLPNQAAEHYYLITDSMPEVDSNWPVIEDPENYTYIRPEGDGLMIGLFEGQGAVWNPKEIPRDFSFGEIEPDWERMTPYVEAAMSRVPASLNCGVKKFFCGPESFTPDLAPAFGETPEIKNYYVAAGLNSIGILTAGGIGRSLAHWIMHGLPDIDVTGMNIDRFQGYMMNEEFRKERVKESLGLVYKCHYPYKTYKSGRNVRFTPFAKILQKEHYAVLRDVSGWECADWFYSENSHGGKQFDIHDWNEERQEAENLTFGRPSWFEYWKQEHEACREGIMLLDMSFMSKFMVEGKDAGEILNYLSTANVNQDNNRITYTQWLNENGTLEADVTITKLASDKFLVIATDTMHRHTETHMKRAISNQEVKIKDVTSDYAQLNIQGPLSRKFMSSLISDSDSEFFSNDNFTFRDVKQIEINKVLVHCARITYLGELGYELYIPSDKALSIYNKVMEISNTVSGNIKWGGLKALSSLRLEKGYRDYGHDMDNTDTLMEMGLGFTADMSKPGGFMGKEVVTRQKAEMKEKKGLMKRLVNIFISEKDISEDVMLYHGEVLYRDGECVGDVRAGSYGHTLKGLIGLAHVVSTNELQRVNREYISTGKWEVQIGNQRYPCTLSFAPIYDPKNERIKG